MNQDLSAGFAFSPLTMFALAYYADGDVMCFNAEDLAALFDATE